MSMTHGNKENKNIQIRLTLTASHKKSMPDITYIGDIYIIQQVFFMLTWKTSWTRSAKRNVQQIYIFLGGFDAYT
jgi:hypothetical protein